jgi:hypothetical protein
MDVHSVSFATSRQRCWRDHYFDCLGATAHQGASAMLRNALTSAPSSLPSMPLRIW